MRSRLLGVGADGSRDWAVNPANTHLIEHGGRLFALCEGGFPYEVTPELETVGPEGFGGRLATAMTAHPKLDPVTGELHFLGYGVRPPYPTYHSLSTAGALHASVEIDVPGPTMMHDFAIIEHITSSGSTCRSPSSARCWVSGCRTGGTTSTVPGSV